MDKELRWKLIVVVAVIAFGLFFAIPWDRPLFKGKMRYGLDIQGGTELLYQLQELPEEEKAKFEGQDIASQIIEIIMQRIDAQGVKQPRIQKQGTDRILIQLPGADEKETNDLRKLIQTSGHLKFRLVAKDDFANQFRGRDAPTNHEWLEYAQKHEDRDKELVMIDDGYNLGGEIIKKATESSDDTGYPAVGFEILRGYQEQFAELTYNNSEDSGNPRKLAIIMDGKIISAPIIKSKIRDNGIITGGMRGFERKEQKRLITVLNSGRFPVGLDEESVNQVGPGTGSDSIRKGIRAILIAGIAVLLFMMVYYLGSGLIANFALCLNLVLILASMNMLSATMTLPGIAGVLLTVGIAVDANILIFERIREEKDKGKTLHQALKNGYERALVTIVDANVTTLITAAILWIVGTGPVRGFAVTLSIGILASMFTSIFVTRVIFELLFLGRAITQFRMLQIVRKPRFNFLQWSGKAVTISCLALAVGVLLFSYRGKRNLGIDFREGTIVDFNLKEAVTITEVRERITTLPKTTDKGTQYPYRYAEVQEMWEFDVAAEETSHRFEVRTGWAVKPDEVRKDVHEVFKAELVPGPFENPPGVESVSGAEFEFAFTYYLKKEAKVEEMKALLLKAFQEGLPEALGEKKDRFPGTLTGTNDDEGRDVIARQLRFKSERIPYPPGGKRLLDRLQPFLNATRNKFEGKGWEIDGDFPQSTPSFTRYATLTLGINFLKPVKPEEV
ncbi:MAG: protein translocase subunit SecD, partial [Planctomycetota bacterium]